MNKLFLSLTFTILFSGVVNFANAQKVKTSTEIMEAAYKKASEENKNILLIFHASWCSWCKKMDAAINDKACKKLFEDNYCIVHLTVEENDKNKNLENPGAAELKNKFNGESSGLPFWVILYKSGKILGDSYIRQDGQSTDIAGENMGCPAAENEVAAFSALLKRTSNLTDEQLLIIEERFKHNK
jgi:thioredoxin-related protein